MAASPLCTGRQLRLADFEVGQLFGLRGCDPATLPFFVFFWIAFNFLQGNLQRWSITFSCYWVLVDRSNSLNFLIFVTLVGPWFLMHYEGIMFQVLWNITYVNFWKCFVEIGDVGLWLLTIQIQGHRIF